VAESGVYPTMLVLLANWFPRFGTRRANAYWNLLPGRWRWRVRAGHRLAAGSAGLADDAHD